MIGKAHLVRSAIAYSFVAAFDAAVLIRERTSSGFGDGNGRTEESSDVENVHETLCVPLIETSYVAPGVSGRRGIRTIAFFWVRIDRTVAWPLGSPLEYEASIMQCSTG